MSNKVPSFKNIDTDKFIYGREITEALYKMEYAGDKQISVAGVILKKVGTETNENGEIILIRVVK